MGKTQSGKTHWEYYNVYSNFKGTRIFIDPKPSNYVMPTMPGGIRTPTVNRIGKNTNEIILVPHFRHDYRTEMRRLLQLIIYQKIRKNDKREILIVIDEMHRWGTKHSSNIPELDKIINEGASHNIHTHILVQHPNKIQDTYILNAERVVMFGDNPVLMKYLEDKIELEFTDQMKEHLKRKRTNGKKQGFGIYYDYNEVRYIVPSE